MKNNKNDNLVEVDAHLLYECRFVILIEIAPLSNKYVQIQLSPKNFVEISKSVGNIVKEVRVDIGHDKQIELPDSIRSCYDI